MKRLRYWRRYISYRRRYGKPSYLQREFMKGDPHGKVAEAAQQIIDQMQAEGIWDR